MNQTCVIKNSNVNAKDPEFDSHLTTKAENYHSYCKAKQKKDSLKKNRALIQYPALWNTAGNFLA